MLRNHLKNLILTFVICIAMVITMMPASALAADTENYGLWVGGTRVSSDKMSDLSAGWSYDGDAEKGTLTLTNATITGSQGYGFTSASANIYVDGIDLTIRLVGENTLSAGGRADVDGIRTNSNLTITGDGSLEISASADGDGIFSSGLTIKDASVKVKSGDHCIYANGSSDVIIDGGKAELINENYGIVCSMFKMSNNAELTLKEKAYGLDADGVEIKDSTVNIESGNSYAIYADDYDVIFENSDINIKTTDNDAVFCYTTDMKVTDSKVVISSIGFAIRANSIDIRDGSGSITTYVEAATTSSQKPAIFADTENGITLGENIDITTPAGGEFSGYTYADTAGTTVNDQDGAIATHVIIQGQPKPEPEPTPEPEPAPTPAPTPASEEESAPVIAKTPLIATVTAKGKNTLQFKWNKISGADGYDIFLVKCGGSNEKKSMKKAATVKGDKVIWKKTGLKAGSSYKAVVKAWVNVNGKKTYVKSSPLVHAYTSGGTGRFTNPKSVTVKKTKVTLKEGKTYKVKASVKKLKKSKVLMPTSHGARLRYLSSDTSIAKVSKSGKITAKKKGTCTIYVYAQNGAYKKVKVTVK